MIVADACLDDLATSRLPLHRSDDEDLVPRIQLDIARIVRGRVRIVASHQVDANIPLFVAIDEHECPVILATEVRTPPGRLRTSE